MKEQKVAREVFVLFLSGISGLLVAWLSFCWGERITYEKHQVKCKHYADITGGVCSSSNMIEIEGKTFTIADVSENLNAFIK